MILSETQQNNLNQMTGRLTAELQTIQNKSKSIQTLMQKIQYISIDKPTNPMTEKSLTDVQIIEILDLITTRFNEKFPVVTETIK